MITVYHLIQSRSERVLWLLEELGEPYEVVAYKREKGEAPAAYRALHPMGTSPIIRDGELLLVETGAIVEYILDRYGRGRLQPPRGTPEHARYLQWLHFAEGNAATNILTDAIIQMVADPESPRGRSLRALWRDRNLRMMPYLDAELAQRPYFAGEAFTAADIMMAFSIALYERFLGKPLADHPHLAAYCERVFARPAYLRAAEIAAREPA